MRIVAVDAAEAAALRAAARREPNARTRVRLLGVANALSGMPIEAAGRAVGAGRATLYDWLGRYRAEGADGLRDRPRSGRRRLLTPEQDETFRARIVAGPEKDGVTAFRGVDMQRILKEEFKVKAGLSSAYQLAHRLGLTWVEPRPQHPKSDPAAQAAYKRSPPQGGVFWRPFSRVRRKRRGMRPEEIQQASRPSSGRPAPTCRTAPRSRSGSRTR
jgi:transposase